MWIVYSYWYLLFIPSFQIPIYTETNQNESNLSAHLSLHWHGDQGKFQPYLLQQYYAHDVGVVDRMCGVLEVQTWPGTVDPVIAGSKWWHGWYSAVSDRLGAVVGVSSLLHTSLRTPGPHYWCTGEGIYGAFLAKLQLPNFKHLGFFWRTFFLLWDVILLTVLTRSKSCRAMSLNSPLPK